MNNSSKVREILVMIISILIFGVCCVNNGGVTIGPFYHFVLVFLITVFLIMALFYFILIGCAVDINILTNEEIEKIRDGKMRDDKIDTLSLRTTLSMINLCVNVLNIRKNPTDSALTYLMPKVVDRKTPLNACRETILIDGVPADSCNDNKMIVNSKFEPRFGRAESEVTSEILCSTNFDIVQFVNQDKDLGGYSPLNFSDLLSANIFEKMG